MIYRITLVFLLICSLGLAAEEGSFSETLYPVLERAGCQSCHNSEGVASVTRLQFPELDASPEAIAAFGNSLVALVDRENPEQSFLLNKPTNRIPHAGGERIVPGSEGDAALKAWVEKLASLSGEELEAALNYGDHLATEHEGPQAVLRRLTHSQYNNTVRDLLGDYTNPANQFPPDDYVNGFKNQYMAQNLSPLLIESFSDAAERLAQNAFRGGDMRDLIPCDPSPECRSQFVQEFGLKAFRRPLGPAEQQRYEELFEQTPEFVKGAQIVVEAMLQSPHFLFRLEETENSDWKPYARAARLSYALWDTMPDAALFEAARRGDLSTQAGLEKEIRRLLAAPEARDALDEFVSQWMKFDRVITLQKDRRQFPQFTRETAVAMTQEAQIFISDLVWNDRNFMDLFTADYSFVNTDLAAIYGMSASGEFERAEFPEGSERSGLLGQALFLSLAAKPDDTSPTARGLFVREQFLCQHVSDPPPGIDTNLPPINEAKPETNRERLGGHVTQAMCSTCHNLIDPIGFGFEKFDAIGKRRENFVLRVGGDRRRREEPKVIELPLDTSGFVAGLPNSEFTSPVGLGEVLAESEHCQECIVKQYFRYTFGRMDTPADRSLIQGVLEDFRNSDYRFQELMASLIRARESLASGGGAVHVASHHETR